MSNVDKIAKDLAGIIKSSDSKGTAPYDTKATVKKVENGIAWVQIPGGVDETPVQMTLSAKAGDTVQVRVSGGRAWITGNGTAPPTDDTRANAAHKVASKAYSVADTAILDAQRAHEAADSAEASADQAQTSAENAGEYAARALGNLSTVQSVTETLNWITAHGTMTITTDTALDPTHVYFVRDNDGDYEVGSYHYSVVTEPKLEDISTYYVLSIDESLNNYVGTHMAVTSEGLWLLPDAGGNKVLIATGGQGHTYEEAGTYIIKTENAADVVLARFTESGARIGKEGESQIVITSTAMTGVAKNGIYFDFNCLDDSTETTNQFVSIFNGKAKNFPVNYSKYNCIGEPTGTMTLRVYAAGSFYGDYTKQSNVNWSQNIDRPNGVPGYYQFSYDNSKKQLSFRNASPTQDNASIWIYLIYDTTVTPTTYSMGSGNADGDFAVALNNGTLASKDNQTVIGKYNIEDNETTANKQKAFIIGNGSDSSNRSNALTVDWLGEVQLYLDVDSAASKTTAATSGEDKDLFNAIRDLGWYDDVIG